MRLRTIRHYLREAFRSLIKNRLMSITSVLTVASCIFIVSVFYILATNVNSFLEQAEEDMNVIVAFISDDVDDVSALYSAIQSIPNVSTVGFVTRQMALDRAREWLPKGSFELLEHDNPLPRSFDIEIADLRYASDVIIALEAMMPELELVSFEESTAETALTITNVANVVSMVLILLLAGVSIVIITNTIRITVNARQTEINIMKYVGATDWFIRGPFVIEGLIIGLVGAILPTVICWIFYDNVVYTITSIELLNFLEFRPNHEIFNYLFPFALALGSFIGLAGSLFSVHRYLKV